MSNAIEDFATVIGQLVGQTKTWAESAGWATSPYPKRMRTPDRSVFEVPALYLQKGPMRLLLDPIAYDVPGAEAVVDLYLMPTYEDMASLYCREGRWEIHYGTSQLSNGAASMDKVDTVPLSEENLIRIIDSIASHATPSV